MMNILSRAGRFVILWACLGLLAGCAVTSTVQSNVLVKPAEKIQHLRLIYIEGPLAMKESWRVGYFPLGANLHGIDHGLLPSLIEKRSPAVFAQSGIEIEYESFWKDESSSARVSEAIARGRVNPGSMSLTLQISDASVIVGSSTPRTAHINFQANLVDPVSLRSFWNGKFRSTFVQPPVGRKGFNDETVDALLNNLLDQLAKDGMVPPRVH